MGKTIGDLAQQVSRNSILTTRIVEQLKAVYPIIHHADGTHSEDYICMKNNGEKCGGYCPQCTYGVKTR